MSPVQPCANSNNLRKQKKPNMSNNMTPCMSTTTNVQTLSNPPYSPYFSGNSRVANNLGSVVKLVSSSSMGGGGRAGGPGRPGAAQYNNQRAVDAPVIGGGIGILGRPWTGGSLDPRDHDYHFCANAKLYTVCCLRTEQMESKNHKSISSGVETCTKLTRKSNLLLSSKTLGHELW